MATPDEYLYALTDTWNGGTTDFHALKMSVTDAASGAGSKLIEFDVNGNPRFTVDKLGNLFISGTISMGTSLPIVDGGTGAETAAQARENLGITAAIDETVEEAVEEVREILVRKAGDRMTGSLSSAVKDHGTLEAVTEEYKFAEGNTHKVTVNATSGTHTINPTGLAEGDVMQVNILYTSGTVAVFGATQWELGGGQKSANLSDLGIVLVANAAYRIVFEIVAGVRTGVFQ